MFFAHTRRAGLLALATVLAPLLLSACATSPKPPGTVAITFSTKQGDENLFVWGVSLDGASPHTINSSDVAGTFTLDAVPVGDHHLILSSLPTACSSGADNRVVTVPSKDTVRVTIGVKCTRVTGDIALSVLTSGVEFDADGYTVNLDGAIGPHAAASSLASLLLPKLTPGAHEVTLSDLAANCSVAATEPHTAVVVTDQAVTLSVNVVCRSTAGTIQVVTNTNDVSTSDPDGYILSISTMANISAPNTGQTSVSARAGTYIVTLGDIEPSCSVASPARSVTIAPLQTVAITFDVTCGAYPATVAGVTSVDPVNDTLPNAANNANASLDLVAVNTRYATNFMIISLKFNRSIAATTVVGVVDLDLDENASTGVAPLMNDPLFGGSAPQGIEERISFVTGGSGGTSLLFLNAPGVTIRSITDADSIQFFLPYAKLNDDGNLTITTIIGPLDRPTDYAPNTGVIVSHVPAGVVAMNRFAPYRGTRSAMGAASALLASKQFIWGKPR
jgi:hypothetical protein